MNPKIIYKMAIAAMLAFMPAFAQAKTYRDLAVSNPDIARSGDSIRLDMNLDVEKIKVKRTETLRIVPVIKSIDSSDSVTMRPITVAGKNAWYGIVRNSGYSAPEYTFGSGEDITASYSDVARWEDWMEHSKVFLVPERQCCGADFLPDPEEAVIADIDFRPMEFNAPFYFVAPVDSGPKVGQLSGRAYINFPVNKTEIYPYYMNNPAELSKILNTIDNVKANPDMTVDSIFLTGYASPEGPWTNNVRLAAGRTEALKDYVKGKYTFPASVFHTASVPEDWDGLREYVAGAAAMPEREAILALIDDPAIPEADRNDVLKRRFPEAYAFLLKEIYPALRHTDYTIAYTVRTYTDVEEIKRIIKTAPGQLSLNEFYQAAISYGEGTPEFQEVFDVAVRMFPNDPIANLNAGIAELKFGNLDRAETYLAKAGDSADALFASGVLAAMNEDFKSAEALFRAAARKGKDISEALASLRILADKSRSGITYAE